MAFAFDLKSGYHHIDIHESCWKYLGFMWSVNKVPTYFVFKVLPFGLSLACYLFTKLLRPLVKYWRGHGYKVVVYLDDGICSVKTQRAETASRFVQESLANAGFVAHPTKSHWSPSYQVTWLGFDIDLQLGQIIVPTGKVQALQSLVSAAIKAVMLLARDIARIIEKIISLSLAVGPLSRLMTRSLYAVVNERYTWSIMLSLSPEALCELKFWKANLKEHNSHPLWREPGAIRLVYSDANDKGFGGYIVEHGQYIAHGHWDAVKAQQSSTWCELKGVRLILQSLISKLQNCKVKWLTDNHNVSRILLVGSKSPILQREALGIFSLMVQYSVFIEPE